MLIFKKLNLGIRVLILNGNIQKNALRYFVSIDQKQQISDKLIFLRKLLSEYNIDAYVIPHSDPHQSEYLPACDERIKFISGFSGSNALAFVTNEQALLWTDSRYFLQAELELEKGWKMCKMLIGELSWFEWAAENLPPNSKIGYDPYLIPAEIVEQRSNFFLSKNLSFNSIPINIVDTLWHNKPDYPKDPVRIYPNSRYNQARLMKVYVHDEIYAGISANEKLEQVGKRIQVNGCSYYLLSQLEDIAWLLNLRGSDHEQIPYFISYLLLKYSFENNQVKVKGDLFILEEKVNNDVKNYLKNLNINIISYFAIGENLQHIMEKIYVTKTVCNAAVFNLIPDKSLVVSGPSIVERLKCIKNQREIQGFRECHIRDGAAIVAYLAWLDHQLNVANKKDITEYQGAEYLRQLRKKLKWNKGQSFGTISSIGKNAAIVHYNAEPEKAAIINNTEIYLLDSGGQYLDGTTDTTRTTHFGTPNDEEKDSYTRVLRGNLDIERLIFPKANKIHGGDIDILARRHLWAKGRDYGHGTGHGVGYFLNVHEGPQGISKFKTEPLVEGMIVSNEPGYYKSNEYGIRIENLLLVISCLDGKSYTFENLTHVPYEKKLIDTKLLTKEDIEYIDKYHEKVFNTLKPILEEWNDKISLKWLELKTSPLTL